MHGEENTSSDPQSREQTPPKEQLPGARGNGTRAGSDAARSLPVLARAGRGAVSLGSGSNLAGAGCSRLGQTRRDPAAGVHGTGSSHLPQETFPLTSYSKKLSGQSQLPSPWLLVTPGCKSPACSHPGVCRAVGPGRPMGACPSPPIPPGLLAAEGSGKGAQPCPTAAPQHASLPHGSPALGQPDSSPPSRFLLRLCPHWQRHPGAESCPRGVTAASSAGQSRASVWDTQPFSCGAEPSPSHGSRCCPLHPKPSSSSAGVPARFGCENAREHPTSPARPFPAHPRLRTRCCSPMIDLGCAKGSRQQECAQRDSSNYKQIRLSAVINHYPQADCSAADFLPFFSPRLQNKLSCKVSRG